MRFCSLSSCSYANSVVVQNRNTCILIDCGLKKRDLKPFLDSVGLSIGDIDAVLVTHCHTDHVYGLKFLLKGNNIPVYSTANILKQLYSSYRFNNCPSFSVLQSTRNIIGGLAVTPLALSHDFETIGFIIASGGERLGYLTDTGYVPEKCLQSLQSLDYLYIESNHDVEMYRYSSKPWPVIKRNTGPTGHLSNEQCGQALQLIGLEKCKLVMLGHLSEKDNEPPRALSSARRYLPPKVALVNAPARFPGLWSDTITSLGKKQLELKL